MPGSIPADRAVSDSSAVPGKFQKTQTPLPHAVCTHCGFPVRGLHPSKEPQLFCCYGCSFAHQIVSGGPEGKSVSWITVKLGIAGFMAMNVMGFALALHASSVYPDFYFNLSKSGKIYEELLRYLLLFLSAPVYFLVGAPLFENVIREARDGRWGVEGFIALSVIAATGYSLVSTVRGSGPVYYDLTVMVLFFLTLGRYLEAKFRFKATQSLEHLLEDQKQTVTRLDQGREESVQACELKPGDEFILRSGERVPVDGRIEEGRGVLETAPMTGEFLPVAKQAGDSLWAGALLTEGFFKVRVVHIAAESWLARLRETLKNARESRAAVELFADRTVRRLTWVTVLVAVAAFVLGAAAQGWAAGLFRALAVLVIVCPCALGAAIPLSLWKSFESIVSRGVLFKDLGRLEMLAKVRGVFFDKTGTLTEPLPRVEKLENFSKLSDTALLSAAASAAQVSAHPFSRALVRAAAEQGMALESPVDIETRTGEGVSAVIPKLGRLFLGNRGYLAAQGINLGISGEGGLGQARVWIGWDRHLQGIIHFEEKIREAAPAVIRAIRSEGLTVGVLTGDAGASSVKVRKDLQLEVVCGLTPQGKLDWIRDWEKQNGPALGVGEGLNDAPMLAAAGVSLALGGALEKTRDAADFVLPDDDLSRIPWLIHTARMTMKKIRRNLFWAFSYNVIAIPLALSGKINPVMAALAMIGSSFFIIIHSLKKER